MIEVPSGDDAEPCGAGPAPRPVATADPAGTTLPPKLVQGYIDFIDGRRVFGWAWCRSAPSTPVDVEIRYDGRKVASVLADGYRQDLAKGGAGDGRHAFDLMLDDPVPADRKALVSAFVRCGPSGPYVPLVNRTIGEPDKEDSRAASTPGDGSRAAAADLQPVLAAISVLQKRLDDRLGRLADEFRSALPHGTAPRSSEEHGAETTDAIRDDFSRLTTTMEVLQLRLDTACAAIDQGLGGHAPRGGDRALTLVVVALGLVSCASLVLGLIAVFG